MRRQLRQFVSVAGPTTLNAMGECGAEDSALPMPLWVQWRDLGRVSLQVANEYATACLPRVVPCVPDDPGAGASGGAERARTLIMEDAAWARLAPTPELMAIQLWEGGGPEDSLPWQVVTNVPDSVVHDLLAPTVLDLTSTEAKVIAEVLEPVLDALPGVTNGPVLRASDARRAITMASRRGAPDPCGWRMDHLIAMAAGDVGNRFGEQVSRFFVWLYDGEPPSDPGRAAAVGPIAKLWFLAPRWLLTALPAGPSAAREAEVVRRAASMRRGEWDRLHEAGTKADAETRGRPVTPSDPIQQCRAAVAAGRMSRAADSLRGAATALPMAGVPLAFSAAVRQRMGLLHPQDGGEGYGEAALPFPLGAHAQKFYGGGRLASLAKGNADEARRASMAEGTAAEWAAAEERREDDFAANPARRETWGCRPTVTGAVPRRIAAKAFLLRHGKHAGGVMLRNGQFAVSVAGGADIFAHAARVAYLSNPDFVLMELDCTNAFNQARRSKIAEGLRMVSPQALPIFNLHYAVDTVLRTRDGAAVLSRCGVQQGDGLGTFFFCACIHPLLGDVKRRFPRCTVLAWSDNIVVAGPVEEAAELALYVKDNVADYFHAPADGRPILNPSASSVLCARRTLAELASLFPGFQARGEDTPVAARGSKILGSPVGTDAFVRAWLEEHLASVVAEGATWEEARAAPDGTARDCALLRHLGAESNQDAELLLEYCTQARLLHLWRVVPPAMAMEFAARVQLMIHGTVADVNDLDFGAAGTVAAGLCSLPRRASGKGFHACDAEHVQSSFTSSVARFLGCVIGEGVLPNLLPAALAVEGVMRAELDDGAGVEAMAEAQPDPRRAGGDGA
jgi:hypothetical protein